MLNKKIAIVGYSGHGIVVAEAALMAGLNLRYYTEKAKVDINPFNLKYLGDENNPETDLLHKPYQFLLGIGDNGVREKVTQILLLKNKEILNVIHPDSSLSEVLVIGKGNFVSRNVSVNAGVSIGNYCILNTGSIIEHECHLGDFVHVAPGAILAGNVRVGDNSFIGSNAVIKQGLKVGRNVIIGAGSVVLKDVPDGYKMVGNPARKI